MYQCQVRVPALLLLLTVGALWPSDAAIPSRCSSNFQSLFQIYNLCTPGQNSDFRHQDRITGGDVVTELQRVCSIRSQMRDCQNRSLQRFRCSAHVQTMHWQAFDNAMSMCGQDGNVRESITHALTGNQQVPEQETSKAYCVNVDQLDNCPTTLLSSERFSTIQGYGDLFGIEQVLNNSLAMEYFNALFDCYVNIVYPRCPHNTIPMILAGSIHFVSPPKFGVNVTEIILTKAQEIQARSA